MTLARKQQILAAALLCFSVWPLVQMGLVHRFKISPWKLAGWGMYSTPRIVPGIAILVQSGDEPLAPMQVVPDELRIACEQFSSRRLWLHDLAPPDTIGALALASSSDYRRVKVTIIEPLLDVTTGMVRTEQEDYHYQR